MKHKLLSFLLAVLMSMVASVASAHDFAVGGIYYEITSSATPYTASVTYRGDYYDSYKNEYTGSVTIPESVTYSGKTYSVTSIGERAFRGCKGLTSIEIPNSVTSIGYHTFYGCSGLTSIEIPNSVTSIGSSAFYGCSGLTSVEIPNSVTSIGNYAFWACSGLTSITIGNSVTSIGSCAFEGCSGLTSLSIGKGLTSVGYNAFKDCPLVDLSLNCKTVGTWFAGITTILELTLGENVRSIAASAFLGCTNLARADFASIESLLSIDFGNSTANPLYYTKALNVGGKIVRELEVPKGITEIKAYALYNCNSVSKAIIGSDVTSIGSYAFYNNVKLKEIYNYAVTPQNCGKDYFNLDKSTCNLYVLPESVEQYENHQDWYEFNINAMDAETVGVEAIDNGQLTMNNAKGVYDLSGRRMNVNVNVNDNLNSKCKIQNSKLRKGIYIVNGKKLLKR